MNNKKAFILAVLTVLGAAGWLRIIFECAKWARLNGYGDYLYILPTGFLALTVFAWSYMFFRDL